MTPSASQRDMREFPSRDGTRCAQVFKSNGAFTTVFTYGGNPYRRVDYLDEDIAVHIARRWQGAGHLPEDPYVGTERAA